MNTAILEKILGYSFRGRDLLQEALTHRSYLNENQTWRLPHNERLEFLGDAVLELTVTEELFHRYPDEDEGKLTALRAALVNYQRLFSIARGIDLGKYLLLSRGEAEDNNGRAREVILANAMEAVIGAVYLDGGYAAAKRLINELVMNHLDEVLRGKLYKDAKSLLQEKAQADARITPVYRVLEERGPEHEKIFRVGVYFGERLMAEGEGASKQEAELEAAKKALETSPVVDPGR